MGNRQKSIRSQFYQQKQKKLLSAISSAKEFQSNSNQQEQTKTYLNNNLQQLQSILTVESLEYSLNEIKYEILLKIDSGSIVLTPPVYRSADETLQSFEIDEVELHQFKENVIIHLNIYGSHILNLITSYNTEMQMEQITQKNWEDFCLQLEKHQLLRTRDSPAFNKDNGTFMNGQNLSTIIIPPINNISGTFLPNQASQICTSPSMISDLSKETSTIDISSQIKRKKERNLEGVDEEDINVKRDIRRFRQLLNSSTEIFVLFRRVSGAFEQCFLEIYGKEELKVPKQFIQNPWIMEKQIEVDIIFFTRVFEVLIIKMTELQQPQTSGEDRSYSQSYLQITDSECLTLPIVNMLFTIMHRVFDRIRFLIRQTDRLYQKKAFTYQKQFPISKLIHEKHLQLESNPTPYHESIEIYKRLLSVFRKNLNSGAKSIKTRLKTTILREVHSSLNIQEKSMSNESVFFPKKVNYLQKSISSSPNNLKSELYSFEKYSDAIVDQANSRFDTYEKDIFYNANFKQNTPPLHENIQSLQSNKIGNIACFGADEFLPIYGYIVVQAECQMEDTLYYELRLFNLVFSEIQDRVTSISENILNVTHLLQIYSNLLQQDISMSQPHPNMLIDNQSYN